MSLTNYLSWQLQEIRPFQRFLYLVLSSRIFGYWTVLLTLAVAVCIPSYPSLREATLSILWTESFSSTIVGLGLMRRPHFWDMIRRMQELVAAALADDDDDRVGTVGKRSQEKWAVLMRRNVIWSSGALLCVGTMIIVSMWLRVLVTLKPLCAIWPLYPHAGPAAEPFASLFTATFIALPVCCVGFLVAALSFLTCSAAGLHHALAQRLTESRAPKDTYRVIAMHQKVRQLSIEFTEFFDGSMAQLMAGPIGNSLLATLQVLANDVDVNTFSQIFVVVVTLLQVSYLSQELSDSSYALRRVAYQVGVEARTLAEARALRLVILVAGRTPALSCKGLGRLSLPAAGRVIREFYSAVSVLGPRYNK
ncbi:Odorant receptor 26 [Frankliniella occidentalis]|uniref:Uncharacterized protein LOC127752131 n=1 Tax=Frankliniella occidentalis TaxID=133901 RepID=A0A9C6XW31_FRAOC|nr:uncharacterized protein LOC127752131 [Frankliniella occidentalis]KAE8751724.1 Odorant receptor 26 [Frankliniella occidentalis]